jgi:hypothetical protein
VVVERKKVSQDLVRANLKLKPVLAVLAKHVRQVKNNVRSLWQIA